MFSPGNGIRPHHWGLIPLWRFYTVRGSTVPVWLQKTRRRMAVTHFRTRNYGPKPTAHALFDVGLKTVDDNLYICVAQSDNTESILTGGSHFKVADLPWRPISFAPKPPSRLFLFTSPGVVAKYSPLCCNCKQLLLCCLS